MQFIFRQQAFKICFYINVLLFAVSVGIGLATGQLLTAILLATLIISAPAMLYKLLEDHALARIAYGVSFMLFAALQIHLSAGLIEVHFGIFVLMAILIAFRDQWVILAAAATIAVHHLLFMVLQQQGAGVYVLPNGMATLNIIILHALYVVVEAVVLVVICRSSFKEAVQAQVLLDANRQLVDDTGMIRLSTRCADTSTTVAQLYNQAMASIEATLKGAVQIARDMHEQSQQLSESSVNLSVGLQQKFTEVQRIAAATEELSYSINQLQHLNDNLAQSANFADSSTQNSLQKMSAALDTFNQLEGSLGSTEQQIQQLVSCTQEIHSVLEVIQTIAEQTNLLALNAAIEAARAGDNGRGFAVVASEVRTLASRSHGSTDEIKSMLSRLNTISTNLATLIGQNKQNVTLSRQATDDVSLQLHVIAEQVNTVNSTSEQLKCALLQQHEASGDINASTNQLQLVTQQQTQLAEIVEQTAKALQQMATKVKGTHSKFQF